MGRLTVTTAAMAAAVFLASSLPAARTACDYCALDDDINLQWSQPYDEDKEYPACKRYKKNACCTYETVEAIAETDGLYGDEYSIHRCRTVGKPVSDKCKAFFKEEQCAYSCDPNFGKYRHHKSCDSELGWVLKGAPLASSVCDAWYDACKDDAIPSCGAEGAPECDADEGLLPGTIAGMALINATEASCSRTFADIYGGAEKPAAAFCEGVFSGAFLYEEKEEDAYVFDFPEGAANPNDAVNAHIDIDEECAEEERPDPSECPDTIRAETIVPSGCQACTLRNVHWDGSATKFVSSAETVDDLGMCQKYANNSCCNPDVAKNVPRGMLYGEDYLWDRCDPVMNVTMSEQCRRWFRAESCLYECDVNAGKYRKWDKCIDDFGDANMWQIAGLPLRASECDQWLEDCFDDFFCTCTGEDCPDYVTPRSYFSLTRLDCTADTCQTFGMLYANGSELCEVMWDGAFKYETNEEDAYSMSWEPAETGGINPNDLINPGVQFPATCPGIEPSKLQCPPEVEPKIDLDVVDDIVLGDVNMTEMDVINEAVQQAEEATTATAVESAGGR